MNKHERHIATKVDQLKNMATCPGEEAVAVLVVCAILAPVDARIEKRFEVKGTCR